MFMRRAGRTLIAILLCGGLAAVTASPMARAQNRASAGLPSASGNPMAQMQQQIDLLEQQMSALYGLQSQINSVTTQLGTLSSQIGNGSSAKLAVYDGNQQKMGDVVGVQDNIPWVGLTAGNRRFVLQVFPDQLVGQFLWFDGSNCTGNVFISGFTLNNGANVFALVYAADANTEPVLRSVTSVLDSNGKCSTFGAFNQKVLPASAVMSLDSVFQRPYSVR
jgi:hypothetical protein